MYTDARFCEPCSIKGFFINGDNYCTKCKNYLCLKCSKVHGLNCGNETVNNQPEKHELWLNNPHAKLKIQFGIGQTSKVSDFAFSSANNSKQANYDSNNSSRKKYFSGKNGQAEGRVSSRETRPTYSARGGTVRVTKSLLQGGEKLHRCSDHPEMIIENFCTTHRNLCCENCLITGHHQCMIQPVDEVAHDIFHSGEADKLEHEFEMAKAMLSKMVQDCENRSIVKQRNKIQFKGRNKQDNVVAEREKLKGLKTKCNELHENISICLAEIKNAKESKSEVYTFIALKKNESMLKHAKDRIAGLLELCDGLIHDENQGINLTTQNDSIEDLNEENEVIKCLGRENVVYKDISRHHDYNITLIGDVVLHPFETNTKTDTDYQNSNKCDIDVKKDFCMHDDSEKRKYEKSDTERKFNESSLSYEQKNVNLTWKSKSSHTLEKPTKNRVNTYGLTTEYYMSNNDDEDQGEKRILRIQSAPPERTESLGFISNHETNSVNAVKNQGNSQRKGYLLSKHAVFNPVSMDQQKNSHKESPEGIESENEQSTESYKKGSLTPVIRSCSDQTKRKPTTYTNTSRLEATTKLALQRKACRKMQEKKHKEQSVLLRKKTSILSKERTDVATKASMIKSNGSRSEDQRQKDWIKQSEEMVTIYDCRNVTPSTDADDNDLEPEERDNVGPDFNKKHKFPTEVLLTIKEGTVIKVINPDDRQSSAKSRTSESEEAQYNSQSYAHPPRSQLFLLKEQIIRLPEDDSVCEINRIACMPDGRILVSDFSNMKLKLIPCHKGGVRHLKLEDPPHDVTAVSNSIAAAIAGLAYDALLVIRVGQTLTLRRRFRTDCVCKAVEGYESHIYLLCLYRYVTEVRILSIDGVLSIRLNIGHAIPSPKSISINALNGLIYIIDKNRGLFTIQRCGKILSRCFDKNIAYYTDVDTDLNNNIFVSTTNPCGIYELDYDCKHMLPLLICYDTEIIKAIAYNTANNTLVVGYENSEAIQIYKIHNCLTWKKQ